MPLSRHIQIVRSLKRDRASKAVLELFAAHGAGQRDLTGHGGAADDGFLQVELVADGDYGANVGVFEVGVGAGEVGLGGEAAAVAGEIEAGRCVSRVDRGCLER